MRLVPEEEGGEKAEEGGEKAERRMMGEGRGGKKEEGEDEDDKVGNYMH